MRFLLWSCRTFKGIIQDTKHNMGPNAKVGFLLIRKYSFDSPNTICF